MDSNVKIIRHPNYPHIFVSDIGMVYSLNGGGLLGGLNRDGYLRCRVSNTKKKFNHVLVMEAFIGEKPKGHTVNHKNGIKTDNRLCNLEYVTESENMKHSYAILGRDRRPGERSSNAKLTNAQASEIRKLKNNGLSCREINNIFNFVGISTIRRVVYSKTYKEVG